MLLTIKRDMLELVWAESKDKEISGKLLTCVKGYLISKAKYQSAGKRVERPSSVASCNSGKNRVQ